MTYIYKCPYCGKQYKVTEIPQKAGFRDFEYEICPYCNVTNRKSMEVEFYTEKL